MKQNWLIHDNAGSVEGGAGYFLVVLGQYGAVLVGPSWYWVIVTWYCLVLIACIDKWVKSKFEDAHPLALCSGPKLAIWNKNQPPRPEKTPGHGEKCKMVILLLFGSRRSLGEKETDSYNDSCPIVFNSYDIHTPQTPARHP